MPKVELDFVPPAKAHSEVHIALDFDGTLAEYDTWDKQANNIGKPITTMVNQAKAWLAKGYKISIFTARLSKSAAESEQHIALIEKFLTDNDLPLLPITATKHTWFTHFVDDRAYHVTKNTGVITGVIDFSI